MVYTHEMKTVLIIVFYKKHFNFVLCRCFTKLQRESSHTLAAIYVDTLAA